MIAKNKANTELLYIGSEMSDLESSIIDKIEPLAKARGETLKEVGKNSGVGENSIYRWKVAEPKISSIKKVANYLNINYKILLP